MARNLVICCDGTNNQISGHPTNVLRLFRSLVRSDDQLAYYDGGVGTLVDPMALSQFRKVLWKKVDAAIGHSLRDNFCSAYKFLVRNFRPGDRLYLFGFSRGAYCVRALAGALFRFGLARGEHENLAAYVWAAYSNDDRSLSDQARFEAAARFKKSFSIEALDGIHFIGAWDTVSSLGWIWDYRTLLNTAHIPFVQTVRHALAIDERRACFANNMFAQPEPAKEPGLDWRQVWFAGVHADVGGGYEDEQGGLSKISLAWMFREAAQAGLLVDSAQADDMLGGTGKRSKADPLAVMHDESTKIGWRIIEWLPRRTFCTERGRMVWRMPHRRKRRPVPAGALVHRSAEVRMADPEASYKPPNLPQQITVVD